MIWQDEQGVRHESCAMFFKVAEALEQLFDDGVVGAGDAEHQTKSARRNPLTLALQLLFTIIVNLPFSQGVHDVEKA